MSLVRSRTRRRGFHRTPVSDFHVHSFDAPRERPAPDSIRARTLTGEELSVAFVGPTLIVAVKPNCDGCHEFIHGDLHELGSVRVIVISAAPGGDEWRDARQSILVAPEFMDDLDIRSAPYYVLIDPSKSKVIGEGALFSPAQVASEVASLLSI